MAALAELNGLMAEIAFDHPGDHAALLPAVERLENIESRAAVIMVRRRWTSGEIEELKALTPELRQFWNDLPKMKLGLPMPPRFPIPRFGFRR